MTAKTIDLAVVGLGYVGLPLAMAATRVGLRVVGFDIDAELVDALARGESHVGDVPSEDLAEMLRSGLSVTADPGDLAAAQAHAICVPTPLVEQEPDLRAVEAAAETIAGRLSGGELVVLESTTYPGTTRDVVLPILERVSGLKAGAGFRLAYSPERIDPGNDKWTLENTPKIVGGIDQESTDEAVALYGKVCSEVVVVSSPRVAEMAKLLENTYRHVNIALVNELAIYCHELGVDIREAIRAAGTKPFGFEAFFPGPGVGGHCIPIDPSYLSYRVRQLGQTFRLVELAQDINRYMPRYVMTRAAELLNDVGKPLAGSRILLVGIAYKADVNDTRETPAIPVVQLLIEQHADVEYADPLVEAFEVDGVPIRRRDDAVRAAAEADLVIVITPHRALDLEAICTSSQLTLDTRGAVPTGLAHRL